VPDQTFKAVAIADIEVQGVAMHFYLLGQAEGRLGVIDAPDAVFLVHRLVGPMEKAPAAAPENAAAPIDLTLARPIAIPGALVSNNADALLSTEELQALLDAAPEAIRMRIVALVAEAARRLQRLATQHLGAAGARSRLLNVPAFGGAVFGTVSLRLDLWTVHSTTSISVGAAIEVTAQARVGLAGAEVQGFALVVMLAAGVGARVRIDAHGVNLRLPPFRLPHFDVPSLPPLDLAGALADAVSTLTTLVGANRVVATVGCTNAGGTPTEPKLALRLENGGLEWALVDGGFDPAQHWNDVAAHLARLRVALNVNNIADAVVIDELKLAAVAGGAVIGARVTVQPAPIALGERRTRFGPFEMGWSELIVSPSATLGAAAGLQVQLTFQQLYVRLADDPATVLTFSGILEMDPSGVRVVALQLVAPYPLALVANAGTAVARAADAVLRLALDFAAAGANQLEQLLAILGRMATAAGRSALFLAEGAGGALDALGDLLAGSLTALADSVGTVLARFGNAFDHATQALAIELRIGTAPYELRQALVTLRPKPAQAPAALELNAAGLKLQVLQKWQPALLLDFVSQPGAYIVLVHETADAQGDILALSTDLWLRRAGQDGDQVSALRDADANGGRNAEPLIRMTLRHSVPADAGNTMVVLAGLHRCRPVLLQQLAGPVGSAVLAGSATTLRTVEGEFAVEPLGTGMRVVLQFATDRILPLLGMGEPAAGNGGFLERLQQSLANVVWVRKEAGQEQLLTVADNAIHFTLPLGLKAAGLETTLVLKAAMALDTLEVTLAMSDAFPIESQRIEERAMGLTWVVEQRDDAQRRANEKIPMFRLGFGGGQSGFELAPEARMELRFTELSTDGKGVVFEVATFKIGPGGLDLLARVVDTPVRMQGLDVPFRFTSGELEIKGGRLVRATIQGRGSLPPDLIGAADCSVALTFGEAAGEGIVLQAGKVELDKKNDPVVCHASRFTLTITDLDLSFVKDNGYHFYYLVTGSLRFTPKPGEFESGLLQYLDGVQMDLERTPLSADPRVLVKHISFQKALNPKKTFNLFNLFSFELRGFGYHPASPKFDGAPAVNISGQIRFVEMGDIMQPSIDFHGLWIAPPARGESLPRIKADGLGIDLNLKGSVRVRGSVLAVDAETRTLEGEAFVPPGAKAYGFLGQGQLDIPGWGCMNANLGFLELERPDHPGERRKSFYFYAEQNKLAIEIPTPLWVFYMREVGFGMGFRYTLDALQAADAATSIPRLVSVMDDIAKRQGELHKFSAWKPEFDGDRVTLAMKGAIQAYPATKVWNPVEEERAENPFMFDLVAAIRSDFTLFMGLRGWIGTNYIDYLNDKEGLRSRPGLRGYLYISAPQQRLLARMIGDSKGYIGDRLPALKRGPNGADPPMRLALQSVDWTATLFIKPGLFHFELGWPNQLVARLFDEPNMRVTVRGGMIFRATDDGLLWGYNIEADAFFRFGGSADAGWIGVCAEATLTASLVARVLCYLSWRIQGSLIYGLIALDAALDVAVRAWMEVDLGITSFTIRIGFSVSLQLSAAVEIAISPEGVGARVHARVAISAFGCTLSISVGFTVGGGQLEEARARVQRFLAMSIGAEEPDTAPAVANAGADRRLEQDAAHAEAPHQAPPASEVRTPSPQAPGRTDLTRTAPGKGRPIRPTDFWIVLHKARLAPAGKDGKLLPFVPDRYGFALLVPRQPEQGAAASAQAHAGTFYAAPCHVNPDTGERDETIPGHCFVLPDEVPPGLLEGLNGRIWRYDAGAGFVPFVFNSGAQIAARVHWHSLLPTEEEGADITLAQMFDECFLSDAAWNASDKRITTQWRDPPVRLHMREPAAQGQTDEQRISGRDLQQRAYAASAMANPLAEAVYQTRSTVMQLFIDQFLTFVAQPDAARDGRTHVTDLGLLFYGELEALELLDKLGLVKNELADKTGGVAPTPGILTVLNRAASWFERQDPELASTPYVVAADGIKLDWELRTLHGASFGAASGIGPEHMLHHYEIERTIEGQEFASRRVRSKAAETIGGVSDDGIVSLRAPDFQYTDDLSDLPPGLRQALLPAADEALGLAAALAWADRFATREDISIAYTVTPVDIAGTHGLQKSFLVDVNRPVAPLRPAEAELRFVVRRMGGDLGEPVRGGAAPADSLALLIAVKDASQASTDQAVRRWYELIAVPEHISPSGHYGTDGLTERRLGIGSSTIVSADATPWTIGAKLFRKLTDDDGDVVDDLLDALEPDRETLRTYPYWQRLAGATGFDRIDAALQTDPALAALPASLWAHHTTGKRIATRFVLVTVQEHPPAQPGGQPLQLRSQPVPVSIEVRIEPRLPQLDVGLMRPEAFEWPVHLELPPLVPGQVHARSGFARLRIPRPGATLDTLCQHPQDACWLERDPERRVLTEIAFEAAARFDATDPFGLDACHRSTVAGFDVHELDIDELAPLDTDAGRPFSGNAATWRRARRVARIERLSPQRARLSPDHNRDWLGWDAHYPSESWRLAQRGVGRQNQATPQRAEWYGAAESSIRFPDRMPRMRLFPTAPEGALASLMAGGRPDQLAVRLSIDSGRAPQETADALAQRLHAELALQLLPADRIALGADRPDGGLVGVSAKDTLTVTLPDATCTAALLRAALLRLAACPIVPAAARKETPFEDGEPALEGSPFDNCLQVELTTSRLGRQTGSVALPLKLSGFLHPLLEEVVGELEYHATATTLYRRYTVTVQPVQSPQVKDLAALLQATAAETDVYGWGALQQLGLACTVKLYDRDKDDHVAPALLNQRVAAVMGCAVARYLACHGPRIGQPLVEVLLRPGADRVSGPFDAVLDRTGVESEGGRFALDDSGLSIVQLSLRPVPAAGRVYQHLRLEWPEAGLNGDSARDLLFPAAQVPYEVLRVVDGARWTVQPDGMPIRVPMRPWPASSAPADQLEFFIRRSGVLPDNFGVSVAPGPDGGPGLALVKILGCPIVQPTAGADSPFGRFPALASADWAAMLAQTLPPDLPATVPSSAHLPAACRGFATLLANLRHALPDLQWPAGGQAPSLADTQLIAGDYLNWCQRFLDHSAAPLAQNCHGPAKLQFALAAPAKCNPWQLAADAQGLLTLSFLHADRWAHARAYAVRPTPRYQHLALAAGYYASQAETEALVFPALLTQDAVPRFVQPLGYALAVSPRTERIEPPVFLGSTLLAPDSAGDSSWQLVVARHGEEALAFSNRPLFARLGTAGTALTFAREYRDPAWPRRLGGVLEPRVEPTIYPRREAGLPSAPTGGAASIQGAELGGLANEHPSLWKGADVWRIGALPPHYKVVALAVARAGVVVSRVVTATLDATPRRPLAGRRRVLGQPRFRVERSEAGLDLVIDRLLLVSYHDLASPAAQSWIDGPVDIGWWPDPAVSYTLLRRSARPGGGTIDDEDATVRLTAAPPKDGAQPAADPPIVIRRRGVRFGAPASDSPAVTTLARRRRRRFLLSFRMAIPPLAPVAVPLRDIGTAEQRKAFNDAAGAFARIVTTHVLTMAGFGEPPADTGAVAQWLNERAAALDACANSEQLAASPMLAQALRQAATGLRAEATQPLPAWPLALPWLQRQRTLEYDAGPDEQPGPVLTDGMPTTLDVSIARARLELTSLPTAADVGKVKDSHPAAASGGPLWTLCRSVLLGGADSLVIRALDTRNAIAPSDQAGARWSTPGEVEMDVRAQDWPMHQEN